MLDAHQVFLILIKFFNSLLINEFSFSACIYFKFPIKRGVYEDNEIFLKKGPYGLYCEIGNTRFSIENTKLTSDELIKKYKEQASKVIKEWKDIIVLKGPYGPYIKNGKKNIGIPKDLNPSNLTRTDCLELIKNFKPKRRFKKKNYLNSND